MTAVKLSESDVTKKGEGFVLAENPAIRIEAVLTRCRKRAGM